MTRRQIAEELLEYDIIKNNLYPFTWLSGSSTIMYPCRVWKTNVEFQIKNDDDIYEDFIKMVVEKYKDYIDWGVFIKGCSTTCPPVLSFNFKENFIDGE